MKTEGEFGAIFGKIMDNRLWFLQLNKLKLEKLQIFYIAS